MEALPVLYAEKNLQGIRLDDSEYARAIQCLVVVCTDIAIVDRSKRLIYLAQRSTKPAQSWWWFIGGRVLFGETELASARRCFLRETGINPPEDRFVYYGPPNRYFFKDRQQEPQEVGCDSLCFTFAVDLLQHERDKIKLDAVEYGGSTLRPFGETDLYQEGITDQVRDMYHRIFCS